MKKLSLKSLLSAVLAGILAGAPASPVSAQDPAPPPPQKPANLQGGVPISLGLSKYHYTKSPDLWPNITAPYKTWYVILARSAIPPGLSSSSRPASSISLCRMPSP